MNKDKRFYTIIGLQLIVLTMIVIFFTTGQNKTKNKENLTILRETAVKLRAAGLPSQAIPLYENYLENNGSGTGGMGKIAYVIGELYESIGDLKMALSWYYRTHLYYERENSSQRKNVEGKIVSLLEKLNKMNAARRALRTSVELKKKTKIKGGTVLVEIDGRKIYDYEIYKELEDLDPRVKGKYQGKQGKIQFVQQYVNDLLMYEKALRMQIDTTPKFILKLRRLKKQLLLKQMMEDTFKKDVRIDPLDLKNYFKANVEKFSKKASVRVVEFKVKDKAVAYQFIEDVHAGEDVKKLFIKYESLEPYKVQILREKMTLPSYSLKDIDDIFKLRRKQVTKIPILSKGMYSVFYLIDKTEKKQEKYEDIEERVQKQYEWEKFSILYQELMQDLRKSQNVKIYTDDI